MMCNIYLGLFPVLEDVQCGFTSKEINGEISDNIEDVENKRKWENIHLQKVNECINIIIAPLYCYLKEKHLFV